MDLLPRERTRSGSLLPGALAGCAGMLGFLVLHHIWIVPIWDVLPIGGLVAVPGGIAAQVALREIRPSITRGLEASVAIAGAAVAILGPALLLGELRGPIIDVARADPGLSVSMAVAWRVFLLDLLFVTTITGALAGWLFGRTRRAMWQMALAGFALALGPGHNLPFFVGTPRAGVSLGLMVGAILPAALVLGMTVGSSEPPDPTRADPRS